MIMRVTATMLGLLILPFLLSACGGGGGSSSRPELEVTGTPLDQMSQDDLQHETTLARTQAGLRPNEPYWPFYLGVLQVKADSLERGERSLRESLAVEPGYAPALSLLSKLLYDAGRHDEAIILLETARNDMAPESMSTELIEWLILHYDAEGDLEAAGRLTAEIESRGAVTESVPSFVTLRGDDFLSASGPATRALDKNANSAVNQNNYGITRLHSGDPVTAREAFLKAVQLDPMLPGPLYNLALVEKFYFMDDETAKMWWERFRGVSEADPDNLRELFEEPTADADPTEEGN